MRRRWRWVFHKPSRYSFLFGWEWSFPVDGYVFHFGWWDLMTWREESHG